jgi:hypothetical protein
MKVRSTIALIFWVAYLGTPLLTLHAGTCDMACCVENQSSCPMDEHEDDCVSLEAATPILAVSAPASKSFNAKLYFVDVSDLEIIKEGNRSQVIAFHYHPHPLLLRSLSTPLLI